MHHPLCCFRNTVSTHDFGVVCKTVRLPWLLSRLALLLHAYIRTISLLVQRPEKAIQIRTPKRAPAASASRISSYLAHIDEGFHLFGRANLELPNASENVLSLDGTWRFALHSCPENALASRFFGEKFQEESAGGEALGDGGVSDSAGGGSVRGADGCWRDTPVPSCWQMQVRCGAGVRGVVVFAFNILQQGLQARSDRT